MGDAADGRHDEHGAGTAARGVELTRRELALASLCVAIVCGSIGGVAGALVGAWWASPVLGFAVAWVVCERVFPNAHHYYGARSVSHRIYDTVAIASSVGAYLVVAHLR